MAAVRQSAAGMDSCRMPDIIRHILASDAKAMDCIKNKMTAEQLRSAVILFLWMAFSTSGQFVDNQDDYSHGQIRPAGQQ